MVDWTAIPAGENKGSRIEGVVAWIRRRPGRTKRPLAVPDTLRNDIGLERATPPRPGWWEYR